MSLGPFNSILAERVSIQIQGENYLVLTHFRRDTPQVFFLKLINAVAVVFRP